MQGIGGQAAEYLTMNVHRSDGRVAVLGEAGLVESGYRDVLGDAATRRGQAFDDAHGGQVVYGHHGGGTGGELGDGRSRSKSALKTQVAGQHRPGLEPQTL